MKKRGMWRVLCGGGYAEGMCWLFKKRLISVSECYDLVLSADWPAKELLIALQ